MITFEDTQKLLTVMKEYFYTKEETDDKFGSLDKKIDLYQTTVLQEIKGLRDQRDEIRILIHNMTTLQKWAKPISAKTGIEYPF
jgi:hypothetical protein